MYRNVQNTRVVPERSLRSIPMMDIPSSSTHGVESEWNYTPIENDDLLRQTLLLNLLGSYRDIVEEAETHMFIRLCMMSRRSNDRKRVSDFALTHRSTSMDHSTARQSRAMGSLSADVEG